MLNIKTRRGSKWLEHIEKGVVSQVMRLQGPTTKDLADHIWRFTEKTNGKPLMVRRES